MGMLWAKRISNPTIRKTDYEAETNYNHKSRDDKIYDDLDEAVNLVLFAFEHASPGDIFVQKSPAATIRTLAEFY